ncbi:hypothetical protein BH23ACT5_BH23ACT5_02410 [soil metagenome]
MTRCDFCSGTDDAVGELIQYERVAICESCATAFSHQLGYVEGDCSNCGRRLPEAGRLHGEGDVKICETCLTTGPPPTIDQRSGPEPLPHLTDKGDVHMVDVGEKDVTARRAVAEAIVSMSAELAERFFTGDLPKGDAMATVRLAGIMAAKRVPELIPLAHPLSLTSTAVRVERHRNGVRVEAECGTSDRTGVEMEALTAATVAALALYDMVKGVERSVEIGPIRLLLKSGGRSGTWEAH